jgi:hypothetical protein
MQFEVFCFSLGCDAFDLVSPPDNQPAALHVCISLTPFRKGSFHTGLFLFLLLLTEVRVSRVVKPMVDIWIIWSVSCSRTRNIIIPLIPSTDGDGLTALPRIVSLRTRFVPRQPCKHVYITQSWAGNNYVSQNLWGP